ncbi:MAG: 16S rRNA (guanine(527)-N(7))-methyltransferase RsmG [Clostridia bacterium]|nr:16S rRNA (guanine(527)-N(7))-methyltransferase RsmG [Clostridia bacterium]
MFKDLLKQALQQQNIPVTDAQLSQAALFTEKLVEINESMNLTAITSPAEMVQKHWLDSLALGRVVPKGKVLDVGSGAGFPGIPLHIFYPDCEFTLLDSLQKRLNFIENACEFAAIPVPALLHARAEEAGRNKDHREQYDTVISRAVANLTTLCEYCLPFVKVGGVMIAYKGPGAEEELSAASGAIAKLGAEVTRVDRFFLPSGEERNLIYIEKITATAPCYPRAAKAIKNKPL